MHSLRPCTGPCAHVVCERACVVCERMAPHTRAHLPGREHARCHHTWDSSAKCHTAGVHRTRGRIAAGVAEEFWRNRVFNKEAQHSMHLVDSDKIGQLTETGWAGI